MRLATIRSTNGATSAARVEGEEVVVLPFADVRELLEAREGWEKAASGNGTERSALQDVDLAPVVSRPEKIICVGLNYRDHAAEAGGEPPAFPALFGKYARSLIGPYDVLQLPGNSDKVDWEVELGVIIGKDCRFVDEAGALEAIAGYTVINDVSMRDWQRRTTQYLQGKTFEGSTPIGPWLVTADELGDGSGLEIKCSVDGEVRQRASTSDMVFSPAEIVSYVSQIITLVPGDVISTGTPSGVGAARRPPVFLQDGNVLESVVAGVGELRNRCVNGRAEEMQRIETAQASQDAHPDPV
jgi:acylpyruvate hydrolase